MIILMPLCLSCKHFKKDGKEHWFTCTAFPEGIPDEIFLGEFDHHKKYPNDKGIRFTSALNNKANDLNENMKEPENIEEIEKNWADWSKFRKPKYSPDNKKSVSACEKFARMGIMGPGCARTMQLSEKLYEGGKDDYNYTPPSTVNVDKLNSPSVKTRNAEREKESAQDVIDSTFDTAQFYRNPSGGVLILNWSAIPVNNKKLLAGLFDNGGKLVPTKYREFNDRLKDYNVRRKKKGMAEKKL